MEIHEEDMDLPEAVIEIELDPSVASDMELDAEGSDNAISDEEFIIEFDPELEREDVLHPHIPMSNYDNDRELQEDVECGWKQSFHLTMKMPLLLYLLWGSVS